MNPVTTRQRILDAAQRLIEVGGLARLTTKDIAREAGCAEGTLFKYFKRKEDLCLAVVLENAPKLREDIARVEPGVGSIAMNLTTIGLAALHFFKRLIPLTVSLFADTELLLRHREAMREAGRGPRDVFEQVMGYVVAEQQAHRIDPGVSPRGVASLLLGACFQRTFIAQVTGSSLFGESDDDFVAGIVATLGLGIGKKGGSSSGVEG